MSRIIAYNPRPEVRTGMATKRTRVSKKHEQFGDEYKRSTSGFLLVRNDGQVCLPASTIGGRMILKLEPDGTIALGEPLTPAEVGANLANMRGVNGDGFALLTALCSEVARLSHELESLRSRV